MKKINLIIAFSFVFLLLGNISAEAQRYKKNPDPEQQGDDVYDDKVNPADTTPFRKFIKKLTFGGNFGAQFGQVTFVDISPMVGYRATEKLTVGLGATYNYLDFRYTDQYGTKYRESYNIYGGRLYGQYVIYNGLFAHAEYEGLNVPDRRTNYTERAWMTSPLIGGGYRSQIGKRSYINITALYHLKFAQNQDIFPLYGSPLILRVGFSL
ncbi:MAG: hypothetical protein EOP53_08405 [Sphingobacteriales bacterium]|nr:MAG: hypothetical protein EOP53_08405 [Sphingobacteriales bacterium]